MLQTAEQRLAEVFLKCPNAASRAGMTINEYSSYLLEKAVMIRGY